MEFWKRILQIMSYFALAVYLACNIYAEHSGLFLVPVPHKLAFAAGFIALWTAAVYLGAPAGEDCAAKRRRLRRYLTGLFVYYVWILGNMLFFDAALGRAHNGPRPNVNFYAKDVNLEPLRTIRNYLRAYARGNISGSIVAINLIGNVAAFAPMGFFLPALCRPFRNFFVFTLGTAALVCAVEFTQIVTATGSCDVDDLILNLAGALLIWLVVQLPFVKRHAYRAVPPHKKGKMQ